jgi:ferritin-like metal-binding protein YciE
MGLILAPPPLPKEVREAPISNAKEAAMGMSNLQDLFLEQLKDIYDAEQRITKALPKMEREASSEELSSAFSGHLEETKEQIARLERVFESIGETAGKKTCKAMVGLLEEGEDVLKEDAEDDVKDAALIAAAQKVEHYEMATYGCLRDWARLLGNDEAAELLQQTLDEEGEADKRLTRIAQSLNVEAMDEEGEAEEEQEEEPVRRAAGSVPSRPAARGVKSRTR